MANKVLGDTRIDKRIKDVFGQIDLDGIQTDEFTTREEIMEFEKNDKALEAKAIMQIINNSEHYKDVIPSTGLVTSTKEFTSNPDGNQIKIQYIRPDTDETLPCVYYIHGGGMDLKFPHHECEIAQAESMTNQAPVNYWLHANMLTLNGQKMAKSTGKWEVATVSTSAYSTVEMISAWPQRKRSEPQAPRSTSGWLGPIPLLQQGGITNGDLACFPM